MAFTKPDSASITDFKSKTYADTAPAMDKTLYPAYYTVDAAGSTTESSYQNTSWGTHLGNYLDIAELAGMIDRKAQYIVGKGYKINKLFKGKTKDVLKSIKGNGLDSFNMVMYNAVRTYTIGGDFFAEIIRNKRNELRNLKPLNPGTITVKANEQGIITGYKQKPKNSLGKEIEFSKEEIFHLAYNRMADQIHGQSVVAKLKEIIEMRREAMKDIRVVFHRYVKPLWIFSVDTDDTTEISTFKSKVDQTVEKCENLVVPKDTVSSIERVSIPRFSNLDPLPWLKLLQNEFFKAEGVPNQIMGRGQGSSEAEAKILYLAWQQVVEFNQMFLEEQLKSQLGIDISFEFPASIAPELISDNLNPNTDSAKPNNFGVNAGSKGK